MKNKGRFHITIKDSKGERPTIDEYSDGIIATIDGKDEVFSAVVADAYPTDLALLISATENAIKKLRKDEDIRLAELALRLADNHDQHGNPLDELLNGLLKRCGK